MSNIRAIVLMTLAMFSFAVSDVFIKFAAVNLASAQIILFMAVLGTVTFAILTRAAGQRIAAAVFFHRRVMLRNLFEIIGSASMITALSLAPLALVTSISQSMPLVVTAAAALILGEKVGRRRWIAVFIGLGGVLMILRPGIADITWGAVFALIATLSLSLRDVITRIAPKAATNLQLATYAFALLIPVGLALVWITDAPPPDTAADIVWLIGATLSAAVAYYAITAAMRIGEISAVTPFRYTRLIFATGFAIAILGERPDVFTYIGAAIIIGSGLFVLLRERQLARRALFQSANSR